MSSIKTTELEGDLSVGRHLGVGGNANVRGNATIKKNLKVEGWLDAKNIKAANRGVFTSVEALRKVFPTPQDGWWALVGSSFPAPVYTAINGSWVETGGTGGNPTIEVENIKLTTLEQSEYNALMDKEEDRYYFTFEEE